MFRLNRYIFLTAAVFFLSVFFQWHALFGFSEMSLVREIQYFIGWSWYVLIAFCLLLFFEKNRNEKPDWYNRIIPQALFIILSTQFLFYWAAGFVNEAAETMGFYNALFYALLHHALTSLNLSPFLQGSLFLLLFFTLLYLQLRLFYPRVLKKMNLLTLWSGGHQRFKHLQKSAEDKTDHVLNKLHQRGILKKPEDFSDQKSEQREQRFRKKWLHSVSESEPRHQSQGLTSGKESLEKSFVEGKTLDLGELELKGGKSFQEKKPETTQTSKTEINTYSEQAPKRPESHSFDELKIKRMENSDEKTSSPVAPTAGPDDSVILPDETTAGTDGLLGDEDIELPRVLNLIDSRGEEDGPGNVRADAKKLSSPVKINHSGEDDAIIRETAGRLEATIKEFGIETKVVEVSSGPVITRYELTLEAGVKISKIVNLADNIALSLAAPSIRIVAPIPGKSVIGIEIPNQHRVMVSVRELVDSQRFALNKTSLPIALGKSILGENIITDLSGTPHLLIAGATGSGKSVCVNAILCSLLCRLSPQEMRLLLIDPKMVELAVYNGTPHLLSPVITEPKKAANSLRWVIGEMESRYQLLRHLKVRNIHSYNALIEKKKKEKKLKENDPGKMPFIVLVIDEFADLMMVARKEVEDSVSRLAAMSRAVGIHLILATQRPSVDVITGVIKANFPSRIAFQVSSKIDSRTILDGGGAEKLLGKGDMLYMGQSSTHAERIQGAFMSDEEVGELVDDLIRRSDKSDMVEILDLEEVGEESRESSEETDPLFDEAVHIAIRDQKVSASYLQRKLKIGYNRAARIVEDMHALGLVGEADGSKPREVLISSWKSK